MSQNNAILLKGNFEQWRKDQANGLGGLSPWLYYCVEQFVKPYLLDDEEIAAGITDGGNDGGADAIFIIANQRYAISDTTPVDEKNVSKLRVVFFQVKESGGFKPTEIEKFVQLSEDFFSLSKAPDSFGERYNKAVLDAMAVWRDTRHKVSHSMPEFFVDYIYVTGDDVIPDAYAYDAGDRVAEAAKKYDGARCKFHFVGADQLYTQVQHRQPRSKTLTWADQPMTASEGTVGLVNLRRFYEFLEDEPGVLAERYFDENVRGYQQDVPVNRDIAASLADSSGLGNFWLLNNGVTIVTPKSQPEGWRSITIRDPQIVNGLQTSREIFKFFSESNKETDDRSLLVRVIQTDDEVLQAKITSATNNQNRMQASQLRMTEQIHRDIEELFKHHGLFYDRQKGHYKDRG